MAPPLRGVLSVLGAFLIQVFLSYFRGLYRLIKCVMCMALILSSVDNRNVPWHIWQLTPLLFILHTKGIDLYPSITEDQKRKIICFCESRLIPALVMETLLKSFHLEGWPRYCQFDPLTLFDSVLLLCCLFTKGCPL